MKLNFMINSKVQAEFNEIASCQFVSFIIVVIACLGTIYRRGIGT